MKRFLIGLVLIGALFVQGAYGADKIHTFGWQQLATEMPQVAGWDLFVGNAATGPWTLLKNQPYSGTPAAEYFTTAPAVTYPDGQDTTKYFVAQTIGTSGLRSVYSAVISHREDLRVAPSNPTGFRISTTTP
jgi:hypothetical protein